MQIDCTKNDDAYVKSWYTAAQEINDKYQISAYPTLIFLSPNGDLICLSRGVRGIQDVLTDGKMMLDTTNSYSHIITQYLSGNRECVIVDTLVKVAKEMGRNIMVEKLLQQDYLSMMGLSSLSI